MIAFACIVVGSVLAYLLIAGLSVCLMHQSGCEEHRGDIGNCYWGLLWPVTAPFCLGMRLAKNWDSKCHH